MKLYGEVYVDYGHFSISVIALGPKVLGKTIYTCDLKDKIVLEFIDLKDLHKYWQPYNAKELVDYGMLINGRFYSEDEEIIKEEDILCFEKDIYKMVYKYHIYKKGKLVNTIYE